MGLALEDIAAADLVYRKAKEQGIGVELPFYGTGFRGGGLGVIHFLC